MGKLYQGNYGYSDDEGRAERLNPWILFGSKLRDLREDRDLDQSQMIEAINAVLTKWGAIGLPRQGQSALSRTETGGRSLSALELLAVCRVLNVDPRLFAPDVRMADYNPWLPARRPSIDEEAS